MRKSNERKQSTFAQGCGIQNLAGVKYSEGRLLFGYILENPHKGLHRV